MIKTSDHNIFVDSEHSTLKKALDRARALTRTIKAEGNYRLEIIVYEEKKRYIKQSKPKT